MVRLAADMAAVSACVLSINDWTGKPVAEGVIVMEGVSDGVAVTDGV